jgi:hypothetical protein
VSNPPPHFDLAATKCCSTDAGEVKVQPVCFFGFGAALSRSTRAHQLGAEGPIESVRAYEFTLPVAAQKLDSPSISGSTSLASGLSERQLRAKRDISKEETPVERLSGRQTGVHSPLESSYRKFQFQGGKMRNRILIGLAMLPVLLTSLRSWSQTGAAKASRATSGTATDVSNSEIWAAVQKNLSAAVIDQALQVVSINGEYNVGLGVVRRSGPASGDIFEHSQITEIYHVISGNGTLMTGGALENPRPLAPDDEIVKLLVGPTSQGDKIQGGVSRELGPGDVVIIPPNTPHWFSQVTSDRIVYLVVRVDPKKVLPTGYQPK